MKALEYMMLDISNKRKGRKDEEKDKGSRYKCEVSQRRGTECFEAYMKTVKKEL